MNRPGALRSSPLIVIVFLASTAALSGVPVLAKASSDPRALMQLAATKNGLNGTGIQPWHLKVSFKAVDPKGAINDQGTYEELWVSPLKFKRTLTGTAHTLTDYGTEKGVFRSGDQKQASVTLNDLHLAILNPLPAALFIQVSDVREEQGEVDGVKCQCIDLRQNGPPGAAQAKPGFSYCFDANNTLLQATMAAWNNTQYKLKNSIQFQGRALPGDIEIWNQGTVVVTAHLESIEPVTQTEEAEFQAPPDAVLHDKSNITLPPDLAEGLLLKRVPPVYPPIAFSARVEGVVIIQGMISKEGRIANPHAIGGPKMLQQAALDAVKQWVYRPYMLNGSPVDVDTTIMVHFSLSGH